MTTVIQKRSFPLYKNTIWEKPSDAVYAMIRGAEAYFAGEFENVKLESRTFGEWEGDVCFGCYATLAIFDTGVMSMYHDTAGEEPTDVVTEERNNRRHEECPKFAAWQYAYSELAIDYLRTRNLQAFMAYWMDIATAGAWLARYEERRDVYWDLPELENRSTTADLPPYREFADWLKERDF